MKSRLAAAAVGAATLVAATVSAVVVAAPASAVACQQTLQGVQWHAVYSATKPDGTKVGPANLSVVAAPGNKVKVSITIDGLPQGVSCVDVGLATYRAKTSTFQQGQYQTLYDSDTKTGVGVGGNTVLYATVPQTPGTPGPGCTNTHSLLQNGNGANVPGPYDTTCDGTASGNGVGDGNAYGKACAGCVGNADNKNPPGQLPGPSDHNAGYECDTNQGIAKGNPAHSGCTDSTYWQIDLFTGGVLPYLGTPPAGGDTLYYSFGLPDSQKRLLATANG